MQLVCSIYKNVTVQRMEWLKEEDLSAWRQWVAVEEKGMLRARGWVFLLLDGQWNWTKQRRTQILSCALHETFDSLLESAISVYDHET